MTRGCPVYSSPTKNIDHPRLLPHRSEVTPEVTPDTTTDGIYKYSVAEKTFIVAVFIFDAVFIWTYLIGQEMWEYIIDAIMQVLLFCSFCSMLVLLHEAINQSFNWLTHKVCESNWWFFANCFLLVFLLRYSPHTTSFFM